MSGREVTQAHGSRFSSTLSRIGARARRGTAVAGLASFVLVLAVALAGCGGSSNGSASETTTGETTTGMGTTLQLAADPTGKLAFDRTTLEAQAGEVTIVLPNDSSTPHDVAIEGNGVEVKSDLVSNGETTTVSADLQPGTYTFYCTVPGHEDAGMKGTLTVR